jgi:GMP synthase-like glutamine amidotransferase
LTSRRDGHTFGSEREGLHEKRGHVRALFIQQDHLSPTGPVGDRFRHHGYEVVEFTVVPEESFSRPNVTVSFPDPLDYDVIVPMGAPWAVYDEATVGSWIGDEVAMLRRAHDAGVPVLGICFGGQALAAALGGAVTRAPEAEVGWYVVESDAPELVGPGPWFQWHGDQFAAPPSAHTFARTPVGPQAFTLGRSLGVQFHPELTPDQLLAWIGNGGGSYLDEHGIDADALMAFTVETADEAAARTHTLVDAFLARIASRPVP